MALRLLEIYVPGESGARILEILERRRKVSVWVDHLQGEEDVVKVLVPVEETDGILEILNDHFGKVEGFRVIILPVEATFPRPEAEEEAPELGEKAPETPTVGKISREELYADVNEASQLSRSFVLLMALSAVVAALGVRLDQVAIIIGAMVIAPLLGPNVGLALATTLGDRELARKAVGALALGLLTAVAVGALLGWLFQTAPTDPQVGFRTQVTRFDLLLAVAAGSAGTIAFTAGVATVIVGVMVAVALLPPVVITGMLLGAGHLEPAFGAFLLVISYLVGINLAGVTTFVAQGIRPMTWWEEEKAKRATRVAIPLWVLLLLLLAFVVFFPF